MKGNGKICIHFIFQVNIIQPSHPFDGLRSKLLMVGLKQIAHNIGTVEAILVRDSELPLGSLNYADPGYDLNHRLAQLKYTDRKE